MKNRISQNQDVYLLNAFEGGEWFLDIRNASSQDAKYHRVFRSWRKFYAWQPLVWWEVQNMTNSELQLEEVKEEFQISLPKIFDTNQNRKR